MGYEIFIRNIFIFPFPSDNLIHILLFPFRVMSRSLINFSSCMYIQFNIFTPAFTHLKMLTQGVVLYFYYTLKWMMLNTVWVSIFPPEKMVVRKVYAIC